MSSIHETAYPRFKPALTQKELEDIYGLTDEEQALARRISRPALSRLYFIILLKTVQRLGYFPMLADVPSAIVSFLNKALGAQPIPLRVLRLMLPWVDCSHRTEC